MIIASIGRIFFFFFWNFETKVDWRKTIKKKLLRFIVHFRSRNLIGGKIRFVSNVSSDIFLMSVYVIAYQLIYLMFYMIMCSSCYSSISIHCRCSVEWLVKKKKFKTFSLFYCSFGCPYVCACVRPFACVYVILIMCDVSHVARCLNNSSWISFKRIFVRFNSFWCSKH